MNIRNLMLTVIGMLCRLLITIAALVLIWRLGKAAYDFGYRVFSEPPMASLSGRNIVVNIPEGSTAEDIAGILEEEGLIREARLFIVQERLSEYHGKLGSGVYTLNTGMTAQEIMEEMSSEEKDEEKDGEGK